MFIQMIMDHIPRSWKSAIALVCLFIAIPTAFNTLTEILVGISSPWAWLKFVFTLMISIVATIVFYTEQHQESGSMSDDQVRIETLVRHHKDSTAQSSDKSDGPWHLNEPAQRASKKIK